MRKALRDAPTSAGVTPATTGRGQETTAALPATMGLALHPEARHAQAAPTTPDTGGRRAPAVGREIAARTPTGAARGHHETTTDPKARRTRGDIEANAKITERTHRGATRIVIHGATIDARPDPQTVAPPSARADAGIPHATTTGPTGAAKAVETSRNNGAAKAALCPERIDARAAPRARFDASSRRPIPAQAGHQNGGFPSPSRSNALTFLPVLAAPGWADPIRNS